MTGSIMMSVPTAIQLSGKGMSLEMWNRECRMVREAILAQLSPADKVLLGALNSCGGRIHVQVGDYTLDDDEEKDDLRHKRLMARIGNLFLALAYMNILQLEHLEVASIADCVALLDEKLPIPGCNIVRIEIETHPAAGRASKVG